MPNTTLPTNVTSGTTGHAGFHNTLHAEVNALSRDTGLRDLSTKLVNGWTLDPGGFIYLRRRDSDVELHVQGLNGSAASSNIFLNFGTGEPNVSRDFRPSYDGATSITTASPMFRPGAGAAPIYFFYSSGMRCAEVGAPSAPAAGTGSTTLQWTWKTAMPWPSFLPPAVV